MITATRSNEPAIEQKYQNGLFTEKLLAALNPKDKPDGIVNSHKLAKYIKQEMSKTSQAPQIRVSERTILLTSQFQKKDFQDKCPYRSLDFFTAQPEDAVVFYGRTRIVADLIEKVAAKKRLIGVLGHSGSGKSSLLRAGLLYQLKTIGQRIPGSDKWHYLKIITPTNEPLQKLADAIGDRAKLKQKIDTPIILIIDQFEECFTMCDENTSGAFIKEIEALLAEIPNLQIILGMRSDFRREWRNYPEFNEQISKFNVEKLNSDEIREAIEKPAELVGLGIEPGLTEKLVADVGDYPESLPLLQFTLTELWKESRKQKDTFLRIQTYEDLGKIEGTLEKRADEVYQKLLESDKEQKKALKNQEIAKRLFLEMTQIGDISVTRRRVCLEELANSYHSFEELDKVTKILANKDNRLILRTDDSRGIVVEVVHEALIRDWGQLREWQKQSKDGIIVERKIEAAARDWLSNKKKDDYLFFGEKLSIGEVYLEKYGKRGMLDGLAEEFINESIKLTNKRKKEEEEKSKAEIRNLQEKAKVEELARKEAEKAKLLQERLTKAAKEREKIQKKANSTLKKSSMLALSFAFFAGSFALISGVLGFISFKNAQESQLEKQAANIRVKLLLSNQIENLLESIDLVGKNQNLNQKTLNYTKKLLPEVESTLYQGIENSREIYTYNGHQDLVSSVVFSSDGKYLASASDDGTVKLWDVEQRELIHTYNGHQSSVSSVVFSSDGKYLASASSDNTVKLWDVEQRELIHTYNGHQREVSSVVFSSDGKYLASASYDGTVKLWDVEQRELIHTYNDHQGSVSSVVFSSDGRYLASASSDKTVKLWLKEDWQSWLKLSCQRIIYHPKLIYPEIDTTSGASDVCLKYWSIEEKAEFLVRQGLAIAEKETNIGLAKKKLQEAYKLNETLNIDEVTAKANQLAAKTLVDQAYDLARDTKIEEARQKLQKAYKLNETLNTDELTTKANQLAAKTLVDQAYDLARDTKIEEARQKLQKAYKLDKTLNIDELTTKANHLAAKTLIDRGRNVLQQGNVLSALSSYQKAQQIDEKIIEARSWNSLCWFGSIYGYADKVLDACDKAVELASDEKQSQYLDSRGLARALTGDSNGAIDDFRAYINDKNNSEQLRAKRQKWIKSLENGENPFTKEVLEKLKSES